MKNERENSMMQSRKAAPIGANDTHPDMWTRSFMARLDSLQSITDVNA